MLLRLKRPALRRLAQIAPQDLGALRQFSDYVTKALYCDVPQTKPLPSSDLNTPENFAACALAALRTCIKEIRKHEPSSCNSQTIEFVVQTLPYVAAWVGYFVDHIIIPGRDHGFPFHFAKLSSGLVLQLLLCANKFPMLHQKLVSMKATIPQKKDPSPAPVFFLSSAVSALLHSLSLPEESSREYKLFISSQGPGKYQWQVRCNCFHIIGEIIPELVDMKLRNLPPHALELSDIIFNEYMFFTDAFHSCVRFGLGVINASTSMGFKMFDDLVDSMGHLYRAMIPWTRIPEVSLYMLDQGHLHRTCEMMRTIIHSEYLCEFLDPSSSKGVNVAARKSLLAESVDVMVGSAHHIKFLVEIHGHRVAKQVFDDGAILCLVRAHKLLTDNPTLVADKFRVGYGNIVTHLMVAGLFPYLTHHSVLASAVRARRKLLPFVCKNLKASEQWLAYDNALEDILDMKGHFDRANGCCCDSALCPNLQTLGIFRWKRCSGCEVRYYCSRACQKQDWNARHREICAAIRNDFNTNIRALSSLDRFFREYDTSMWVRQCMDYDHSLVRHIDFMTIPVNPRLQPLEKYKGMDNYDHVAGIVRRKKGIAVVTVLPVDYTTSKWVRQTRLTCYTYARLDGRLIYSSL